MPNLRLADALHHGYRDTIAYLEEYAAVSVAWVFTGYVAIAVLVILAEGLRCATGNTAYGSCNPWWTGKYAPRGGRGGGGDGKNGAGDSGATKPLLSGGGGVVGASPKPSTPSTPAAAQTPQTPQGGDTTSPAAAAAPPKPRPSVLSTKQHSVML